MSRGAGGKILAGAELVLEADVDQLNAAVDL